jgi:hypothetical protein
MKRDLLLPAKYKVWGWLLTVIFGIAGLFCLYDDFSLKILDYNRESHDLFKSQNFTNEIALTGIIIGLLLIVFSKEKIEDEFISYLRLKSLQLAILISYLIFLILNLTFYDLNFFMATFYNSFTVMIIFIIRFQWSLHHLRKEGMKDEE